jgi:hypothetical protein
MKPRLAQSLEIHRPAQTLGVAPVGKCVHHAHILSEHPAQSPVEKIPDQVVSQTAGGELQEGAVLLEVLAVDSHGNFVLVGVWPSGTEPGLEPETEPEPRPELGAGPVGLLAVLLLVQLLLLPRLWLLLPNLLPLTQWS